MRSEKQSPKHKVRDYEGHNKDCITVHIILNVSENHQKILNMGTAYTYIFQIVHPENYKRMNCIAVGMKGEKRAGGFYDPLNEITVAKTWGVLVGVLTQESTISRVFDLFQGLHVHHYSFVISQVFDAGTQCYEQLSSLCPMDFGMLSFRLHSNL